VVVWPLHGIYGSGRNLDETFGLLEAVEKASQIYMLTQPIGRTRILSNDELKALAKRFELTVRPGIIDG
jgi:rhamnulose-1-phosphate aldolase